MEQEARRKIVNKFLESLGREEYTADFGVYCKKCGSTNIDNSYGGEGYCVATRSYTASFDGKHFVKCLDCGNATTHEFYVNINGICK